MARGCIIVTHGGFGSGLIEAIEMVTGEIKNIRSISLGREEPCEELGERIAEAVQQLSDIDEIVIFTDLLGGTPCNQGTLYGRKNHIYTVTGLNMPMLIEFILAPEEDSLDEIVERCMESAKNGVTITSSGK